MVDGFLGEARRSRPQRHDQPGALEFLTYNSSLLDRIKSLLIPFSGSLMPLA